MTGPTVDPARATALRLLCCNETDGDGLDELFESLATGDGSDDGNDLDQRDRRFVRQLVAGVTKWRLHLDWILQPHSRRPIDSLTPTVRHALRLALFQIRWLDRVPARAAVHTAVELTKRIEHKGAASFVNAVLRSVSRAGEVEIIYPDRAQDPVGFLSVYHSHPRWLVKRWLTRWGLEQTEALLQANNLQPALYAQRNPLRADHDQFMAGLPAGAHPRQIDDTTYEVTTPEGFFESPIFTQGGAYVQDVAAARPVQLLAPVAGERILDLCAAPGGKSIQTAIACGDDVRLVACDRSPARLRRLCESRQRLGLRSIQCIGADGDHLPLQLVADGRDQGWFDRVLLDAPCSGTGVLRRHADARWNKRPKDLKGQGQRQLGLLRAAFRALRPGGTLVYSTCSLEQEENDDVVDAFLASEPAAQLATDTPEPAARFHLNLPGRDEGDGSFSARLQKMPTPC
ncbi:MAG: 16S rRNA (cytosine(967)-C(5))-methyltransferase RsmB [Gemmatimonadetes bacterium]|jgi:16S rRNA (cytosine967-C5)-methyltransferase|nr:16S rRNA (cytosine(967)-C(5))-methyltransferase RsmB [Gemmatimonadota bacterium]MBT6148800.1 16S rRNA (cytosine(967)-C(5))-methyltransferase RsmB [Gemmatimonadota bacterium]MBT7860726.1 16S rRNA (cytosine(967)-C(5))-methyltransferase RsmB [Gemmatimonadota bacterium]